MATSVEFTVITPATDLTLLTIEELRAAAGLDPTDTSQDAVLTQYEAEVAAEITSDCAIASDGVNPPTLHAETCSDLFRIKCPVETLLLSRRHVSDIASIAENGVLLANTDWWLAAEPGRLVRLIGDADACWSASKVEVVYTAGFDVIPADLKAEAKWRIKLKKSEASRDPYQRRYRDEIPGVRLTEVDYQIGGLERLTGDGLPSESERRLRRYMTQSMAG
jgi:hypothetical protein